MKNYLSGSTLFGAAKAVLTAGIMMTGATAHATIEQNFGTTAGKDSIAELTGSVHQNASETLLPVPSDGSYTTFAKVGSPSSSVGAVGGIIYVENTASNPLNSTGRYCRGVASRTGVSAKISPIVKYTNATTEFYTSFKVLFGNSSGTTGSVDTGRWQFGQGKNRGGSNSQFDKGNAVSTQGFAVVMFALTSSGSVNISYRKGSTNNSTTGLTQATLSQGVAYSIEIVGNNRDRSSINYTYDGTNHTLQPQKFDIYVDGTLIGNNLTAASNGDYMKVGDTINSISFDGTNSPNNSANIFLDDVKVWNVVPAAIGGSTPPTEKTLKPTISPASETNVCPKTKITLTSEADATIKYSTDGTTFNTYSAPFAIEGATEVWAVAEKNGKTHSDTTKAVFTKNQVLSADKAELSFEDTEATKTKSSGVNLSGVNLSGVNLSVTISGEGFSVDKNTISGTDSLNTNITIVFKPTEAKDYSATLTIGDGELEEPVNISLKGKGLPTTGGEETIVKSERTTELRVYPNPLYNGQLVIDKGQIVQRERVEVYSTTGVLMGVYFVTEDITVISLSVLPAGMYIVRVGNKMARVLKQ